MYSEGFQTWVDVEGLAAELEGAARPGHFRGVATVCLKLFNIVRPQRAYFGQKDAQQAALVQQLVRDLAVPLEIRVVPTVREEDGLALSSRNAYLAPEQRERALALSAALGEAERAARDGERSADELIRRVQDRLRNAGIDPEYVEARDAEDLSPVASLNGGPVLLAVAARVGRARLIDNVVIEPQPDRVNPDKETMEA
jgi:pantoate--beta-alanine ligase